MRDLYIGLLLLQLIILALLMPECDLISIVMSFPSWISNWNLSSFVIVLMATAILFLMCHIELR